MHTRFTPLKCMDCGYQFKENYIYAEVFLHGLYFWFFSFYIYFFFLLICTGGLSNIINIRFPPLSILFIGIYKTNLFFYTMLLDKIRKSKKVPLFVLFTILFYALIFSMLIVPLNIAFILSR